LTCSLSRE